MKKKKKYSKKDLRIDLIESDVAEIKCDFQRLYAQMQEFRDQTTKALREVEMRAINKHLNIEEVITLINGLNL